MKVLSWNLNHRASRHRIPCWLSAVIGAKSPDVAILTEYVEGPDHGSFLEQLPSVGLHYPSITKRPTKPQNDEMIGTARPGFERQNQLLIVTREPHQSGSIEPPALHAALPANVLHIILTESKVNVLGFRMPDYKQARTAYRRQTWEWLLNAATQMIDGPTIITGDFNIDPHDRGSTGGCLLKQLCESGWQHARPLDGCSYRSYRKASDQVTERAIDHTFLSPNLSLKEQPTYDWTFLSHLQAPRRIPMGYPDHAMLITDIGTGGLSHG